MSRRDDFDQQATLFPGFAGYQRGTRRTIPVIALSPVRSDTPQRHHPEKND